MNDHDSTLSSKLGAAIKELRNNMSLTQVDLGNIINRSESTIRKYESGIIEPPISILLDISKALGVPLSSFVTYIEMVNEFDKEVMLERMTTSQKHSIKKDGIDSLSKVFFTLGQSFTEQETLKAVYNNENFKNFLFYLYDSESRKLAVKHSSILGFELPQTPKSEILEIISNLDLQDYIGAISIGAIQKYLDAKNGDVK